jgi:hypothetical protein
MIPTAAALFLCGITFLIQTPLANLIHMDFRIWVLEAATSEHVLLIVREQ